MDIIKLVKLLLFFIITMGLAYGVNASPFSTIIKTLKHMDIYHYELDVLDYFPLKHSYQKHALIRCDEGFS